MKNIEHSGSLQMAQSGFYSNRLITFDDVTIFCGDKTACRNVCFQIEQGDRVALCGKNGSGKSSILKLVCGEDIGYTGQFQKASRIRISGVSQDIAHRGGNLRDYARDNGIDECLFKAMLRKLDFSRIQFEKDMAAFSGGQKEKILIAKSLCEQAHLHVWDEPLNFIDVISRIQIEDLLLAYAPTILFVEHDAQFCKTVATKFVALV